MKFARWLLTALSLLLVFAVVLWEAQERTGPGPLHPAHAAVGELAGAAGCERCHGDGGTGAVAAGCSACHRAIVAQLEQRRGIHGQLPAAAAVECGGCHGEHHGDRLPLLDARSFARAGVPERDRYDHRHAVDFPLAGRHDELTCEQCHVAADAALPPPGGRFLGLATECAGCHEDPHRGGFGAGCEDCHGQQLAFAAAPGFQHAGLSLRGAHAAVTCNRCHAEHSERSVAAASERRLPARHCADCHDDPHGNAGRPVNALRVRHGGDCAACHVAAAWLPARPDAEGHAATGFALRGAHAAVACTDCHGDAGSQPRWTGKAPATTACARCHESPHRPEFMRANAVAQECGSCHREQDAKFAAGRLDPAQHLASGFPLAPPHTDVACARCHGEPPQPFAARFPGRAPQDCRGCHEDVHGGQFARERYAQCTDCHAATTFMPSTFDVAAHAHTAMPLVGAHAAIACAGCHPPAGDAVRRFTGTSTRCDDCHADAHGGQFTVDGRTDCARCHDVEAFAPARFDHQRHSRFALDGRHVDLACNLCHRPQPTPKGPQVRYRPLGTRCDDCHGDPHGGQFADHGRTDCARCHETRSFEATRFDHQRHSRFPLDGNHRDVECRACHVPQSTPAGPIVRFRPLGIRCGDCHLLGRPGGDR